MTTSKIKPTSIRLPEELLDNIDTLCNDSGCSRNEYIITVLDEAVYNESKEPTISKSSKSREPIKLTCKNGELWTHWHKEDNDSIPTRTKFGDCADFELTNGKVYNDSGELVGIIENQD